MMVSVCFKEDSVGKQDALQTGPSIHPPSLPPSFKQVLTP